MGVEKNELRRELQSESVFLIFDGTSRLGEAFATVVRWVDDQFTIREQLLSFKTIAHPMNALQIMHLLTTTIIAEGLRYEQLIGFARDGAPVNNKAMSDVAQAIERKFVDVRCLAHFLNLVGERFEAPLAAAFMTSWKRAIANPKPRGIFRGIANTAPKSSSDVRWWSEWEQVQQVCLHFPAVLQFLSHEEAPVSCSKMVKLCTSFHLGPLLNPLCCSATCTKTIQTN